jgi:putative heme-binding domain-containing protein
MVYRDDLFGPAFTDNVFISEPVHNLVHREVMTPNGLTFTSRRADDEQSSEFLASSDNWFRPTMLATGPDGALWVVDMYRLVIEHPQWIPKEWQEKLDLRAGADQGRIYRVLPVGVKPRPIPRLDKLSLAQLAAAIDSPSGWQRDMVQQMLLWRGDKSVATELKKIAVGSQRPQARVQAICTLDGLAVLDPQTLLAALGDKHAGVRTNAVRLAETRLAGNGKVAAAVLALADDSDPQVQLQVAYSLGQWPDARAAKALARLAVTHQSDRFLRAAVLSSTNAGNIQPILTTVLAGQGAEAPDQQFVEQLVAVATALGDKALPAAVAAITKSAAGKFERWQMAALAGLLDVLQRRKASLADAHIDPQSLSPILKFAHTTAASADATADDRLAAVRLLANSTGDPRADIELLAGLLVPQTHGDVQSAAVDALARVDQPQATAALLAAWKGYGPALKSKVLDVLLSRDHSTLTLLEAIAAGKLPAGDVDAAHRQRLAQLKDEKLRARAAELLASTAGGDRATVVEAFRDVLALAPDVAAGREAFAKRCSVCHKLGDVGQAVGPDVASLSDKSPEFLLTAILDPNRAVEARYADYIAVTDSGQTFTGMLAAETGTNVTLIGQQGKQQVILRSELESLSASGKSLMPEGLEKDLTKQDLANIIGLLRSTGPPRKQFAGNEPRMIAPAADGLLSLPAASAEIYGPTIIFEPQYKNLGFWSSAGDYAVWTLDVRQPGKYQVRLDYACENGAAGNDFVLQIGDKSLAGKVVGTGTWDNYKQIPIGTIELASGRQTLSFRVQGELHGALMDLRTLELRPAK